MTYAPARSELWESNWSLETSDEAQSRPSVHPRDDAHARPAYPRNDRPVVRRRPSLMRRATRATARFLIILGLGVGGTLAWQSYGDEARERIASMDPRLAWLAPPADLVASTGSALPSQAAPAAPAVDPEQVKAISRDLAAVRQSVDQLAARFAAGQQQIARDVAMLQAVEQDILQKIAAPPPRQPAAPAHRAAPQPVQLTPAPAQGQPGR